MRLVVCDDDLYFLNELKTRLEKCSEKNEVSIETIFYGSSAKMLEEIRLWEKEKKTVFFLDIDMPEFNGFEVAEQLQKWDKNCCIVFVSNKDELVFQALSYHPFFFIRKMHLEEELEIQLLELKEILEKKIHYIKVQTGRDELEVAVEDIWAIEGEKNYLILWREGDKNQKNIKTRMRMTEAEEMLMPYGFLRVHKGYLVNLAYVQDLQAEKIVMQNGKDIPIGRSYQESVREKLLEAVFE